MAFLGGIGKAIGLGTTSQVLGSIITGGAISPFKSPQAQESAPGNVQQTIELQSSGSEGLRNQYTQAGDMGLPDYMRLSPRVFDRAKDLIGGGIGGQLLEGAGNFLFGGGQDVCTTSNSMKPFSVNKMSGCVTVSRKQQARLKEMVGIVGLEQTAQELPAHELASCVCTGGPLGACCSR